MKECEKKKERREKKNGIKKPRVEKKLRRGIKRKSYKKWNWAVRLISSELMGNRFVKFKKLCYRFQYV